EEAVVQVAAAVVADRAALVLGDRAEIRDDLLDGLAVEVGAGERIVGLVHVGLVMLVVMQLHRLLVDVRLERVVVIGKGRNLVSHRGSSRTSSGRDEPSNPTKAQSATPSGYPSRPMRLSQLLLP